MIKIVYIDPQLNIVPVDSIDLSLDQQSQYLAGYDQIVLALHQQKSLVVLVKEKSVFRWFQILGEKYGNADVVLEERNLRIQLEEQIGISVPAEISDQQIIDSGLLELRIPAEKNMSFEDYVLQIFIGDFILSPSSLWKISDIASRYEPQLWQNSLRRQLVRDFYQHRLRILREQYSKAGRKGEIQILDWLEESPEVLIKNLFALKVLMDYPVDIGKRVLGSNFPELVKLNLDLRKIPERLSANQKLLDEIVIYLDRLAIDKSETSFNDAISQLSGMLEVEFDFVQRVLSTGFVSINDDLVRKLQMTFKTLRVSPKHAQALDDLDLLVSRPEPSRPSPDWNEDEWITWAVQEYLPYRFWLENIGRLDDRIAEIANAYSEWLYKEYSRLLFHSERMAWKTLLNLKDTINKHDGPVLIVMADNLNTKFYPDLRDFLQHNGFYEHQVSYCISNLPSCTEVSKKSVITGHYAPFRESKYAQSVTQAWASRLGKKIQYLSSIGELRSVRKRDADVYFLNYLPLDLTLHSSEMQTGISHAQAIRSYMSALAQDVQFFARKIAAERELMLIVVSDHGSTRIPKDGVNVLKSNYYKKKAVDEHHRYIEISDSEMRQLQETPSYDFYIFDKNLFELQSNYLVARKLYHFLPLDENVYVHGGLTPEETLVPIAVYKPITVSATPLEITLISSPKIYIGTKVELQFEVTNMNNYSCDEISMEIGDQSFDGGTIHIETLPKLHRIQASTLARCGRMADRLTKEINIRVSYTFLGQPFEHFTQIPVELIDPAESKFDFGNF